MADDSPAEPRLRDTIVKEGGNYFQPVFDSKTRSLNWNKVIERINEKNIKEKLMYSKYKYSLVNCENINQFVEWLDSHKNRIGIIVLHKNEFMYSLEWIEREISSFSMRKKLRNIISKFIYQKGDNIYLRSSLYYYWLPPYLAPESCSIREKWERLIRYSKTLFFLLENNGCFDIEQRDYPYEVKAILYMGIDYLLECTLSMLYLYERESINKMSIENKKSALEISNLCQNVSGMMIGLLENRDIGRSVLKVKKQLSKINSQVSPSFDNLDHYMRELDDNILIYKSALSIARSIKNKKITFTHIISFPYGGIALGYFLSTVLLYTLNSNDLPKLINCHFSSKLQMRKSVNLKFESIFEFIPPIYQNYIKDLKTGKASVLLYDNNTTTFSTISRTKEELMELGNDVYGAAVSVNYENICHYLFDIGKFEPLDKHWQNTLDFQPVSEYVTAFNTWGTSDKTQILDAIFMNLYEKDIVFKYEKSKFEINDYEYKICRVHNKFDLERVIDAGATMIGIHAVYHDKIGYYLSEKQYSPLLEMKCDSKLPVANLEVKSIRKMVENIPNYVKPVLVIEQLLNVDEIKKCCELYGLQFSRIILQLQCRMTIEDLLNIKKYFNKCIISIGALQKDFSEYFWGIHDILNPDMDYILLDLSAHQPDIISQHIKKKTYSKVEILKKLSYSMSGNSIPILIADDTTPSQMRTYVEILIKAGVYCKGIDMQNSTELGREEQKYIMLKEDRELYLVRIRKSFEKLEKWKKFMIKLNKDSIIKKDKRNGVIEENDLK